MAIDASLILFARIGPRRRQRWKSLRQPAIRIYIDADACPVKAEIYRVAERYGLKVYLVSNSPIAAPREPRSSSASSSAANNPTQRTTGSRSAPTARGSIVITADIPLADRCMGKAGAQVIAPNGGRIIEEASIGMALATRDLLTDLRSAGATTRGPPPLSAGRIFRGFCRRSIWR